MDRNEVFSQIVRTADSSISFVVAEIGARALGGPEEPFHRLPSLYPGSRIVAFEVDGETCERQNRTAGEGIHYYPYALGKEDEERNFYDTRHPMCSSLYKPNQGFNDLLQNMGVAQLTGKGRLRTRTLDSFVEEEGIGAIDFIKIDVQGAELDIFQGAGKVLREVLLIVSEVEFVPLYVGQPLFGDVCELLHGQGLLFHHFQGFGGRTLKPVQIGDNPNFPSQMLWSDAVFTRHVQSVPSLSDRSLLKLAVLVNMYGIMDFVLHLTLEYDRRNGGSITDQYMKYLKNVTLTS